MNRLVTKPNEFLLSKWVPNSLPHPPHAVSGWLHPALGDQSQKHRLLLGRVQSVSRLAGAGLQQWAGEGALIGGALA